MAPATAGRVQGAAGLRQGRKRGPPPIPSRIANAKELRAEFCAAKRSIDGVDPEPLTVPKCVECSHCGWPVYPRDSRVASRKTYERAGIQKETAEEKAAKKKRDSAAGAAAGDLDIGDSDEEDGYQESEDSLGTVDALEAQVEEQKERILELESLNHSLETENGELKQQVDDLEESLSAAEEKIELLEESELRWREKNSVLRVENQDLRLYINRLGSRTGDLETDMVKKLTEIKRRKEQAARFNRRRALMLTELERRMANQTGEGVMSAVFMVWRDDVWADRRKRELQDVEDRRRREVGELTDQLGQEKEHVLSLEAIATRLRGSLKAAGQRLLTKVFSTTQKPWADGHALLAWSGAHPAIKYENELVRTQEDLLQIRAKLESEQALTAQLTVDLGMITDDLETVTGERDDLANNLATLSAELQRVTGNQNKNAMDIQRRAEEKAKAAKEQLVKEIWAEAHMKMDRMTKEFEAAKLLLQDQVGSLEAELEAIKRSIGGADGEFDDARVVPKGQGVMCVGCLKQIVNRGVKQLPPVEKGGTKSGTAGKEQKEKENENVKNFFQEELKGMPDPDDILHTEVWKARRDPMKGMRYADFAADPPWSLPTASSRSKSVAGVSKSASRLLPLKVKADLSFKPTAGFR